MTTSPVKITLVAVALVLGSASCNGASLDPAGAPECGHVPGLDLVESAEVLVFGDYHGTAEPPQIFYDATCQLLTRFPEKTFVVGLELPNSFNSSFHDATSEDVSKVVEDNAFWNEFKDGRHSSAMLGLTLKLVRLSRQSEGRLKLVALARRGIDKNGADLLVKTMRDDNRDRAIVLIGNAHARKTVFPQLGVAPFAMNVEHAGFKVVSLNIKAGGGHAWFCRSTCTAEPLQDREIYSIAIGLSGCTSGCPYNGAYTVPRLTISDHAR